MSSCTTDAGTVSCQQCGAKCSAAHTFCAYCGCALDASTPTTEKMRHRVSVKFQEIALPSDFNIVVRRTFLEIEEVGGEESSSTKPRRFTDSFLATKDASICSTSTSEGSTSSSTSATSTPRQTPNDSGESICQRVLLSSAPAESPPQSPETMPCRLGPPSLQRWGAAPQHLDFSGAPGHGAMRGQQGLEHFHMSRPADKSTVGRSKGCTRMPPSAARTTVMLRNVPLEYSRELFVELLNAEGFFGLYDFVYVPMNFTTKSGLGYAFVDFVSALDAACFWKHFEGFSQWSVESDKVCTLDWSDAQQGLGAHIERYRNSPVMHASVPDDCRPLLFKNGVPVAFPAPTRPIKAPRVRDGK